MARRPPVRRSLVWVLCLQLSLLGTLLCVPSSFCAAQPPRQVVLLGPLPDNGLIDARSLNSWLEQWFAPRLAEGGGRAPGAVVAVVQEGRVLLARGFGYADLSSPALARANTVMRVGALSKPITATAVLQLVEDGRLDLRRPVSDYLRDVPMNGALGRPVTALDLVTHTAGFDVRLRGGVARTRQEAAPPRHILGLAMPPQVRPPGQALAYSDDGYALLGRLVESLSGRGFDDYVDARIFRPLGMIRSGFGEAPALERVAATGYEGGPGHYTPAVKVSSPVHAAAGLMTTADDMAAFLVALLGSRGDGEGILGAQSLAEMHRRQFEIGRSAPGVAFGLFEYPTGSDRALVQGGSTGGFRSVMALWPDRRIGLFVSDNGADDAIARDLVDAFARKYLEQGPVVIGTPEDGVARLAGAYRAVSQPRTTVEKVGALWTGDMEVEAWYFGHLRVGPARFEKIGPGAFRNVWGRGRLWFVERGAGGSPTLVTTDPLEGVVAWERQPWYDASSMHRQVLWACFALFASIPFIRWRRHRESAARAHDDRRTELIGQASRTLLWMVGGLDLLFVLSIVLPPGGSSGPMLLSWPAGVTRWALRANLVAAVLALALPPCAWLAWRTRCWTRRAVMQYAACAAGALVFAAWSWYWNLLGL